MKGEAYLNSSLIVLRGIVLDVMIRSDGILELIADDHSLTLGGEPTSE